MNLSSNKKHRRAFFRDGTLVLAAAAIAPSKLVAADPSQRLRVGLMTDLHYADKPTSGSRHYQQSLGKLERASAELRAAEPSFVVELGDLIDRADSVDTELRYLKTINQQYSEIASDRHYVLGNHCVDTLKKAEFLGSVGQERSYYSFDREGFHFIVLDACFRADGEPYGRKNFQWTDANVPEEELKWLASDLKETDKQVIVFAHQRLDETKNHSVKNNKAVRDVLESSNKVLAVFQGHSHKNELQQIDGIHYCTLVAMVEGSGAENTGFALLDISSDGTLELNGFGKQANVDFNK
ncbi:MAG: metallophosphoesterase [Rubripirellula sp.]